MTRSAELGSVTLRIEDRAKYSDITTLPVKLNTQGPRPAEPRDLDVERFRPVGTAIG